jgi:hypothetical protein
MKATRRQFLKFQSGLLARLSLCEQLLNVCHTLSSVETMEVYK